MYGHAPATPWDWRNPLDIKIFLIFTFFFFFPSFSPGCCSSTILLHLILFSNTVFLKVTLCCLLTSWNLLISLFQTKYLVKLLKLKLEDVPLYHNVYHNLCYFNSRFPREVLFFYLIENIIPEKCKLSHSQKFLQALSVIFFQIWFLTEITPETCGFFAISCSPNETYFLTKSVILPSFKKIES